MFIILMTDSEGKNRGSFLCKISLTSELNANEAKIIFYTFAKINGDGLCGWHNCNLSSD